MNQPNNQIKDKQKSKNPFLSALSSRLMYAIDFTEQEVGISYNYINPEALAMRVEKKPMFLGGD